MSLVNWFRICKPCSPVKGSKIDNESFGTIGGLITGLDNLSRNVRKQAFKSRSGNPQLKENSKKLSHHEKVQDKKLCRLRINPSSLSIDPDKVIFNYSNRTLTSEEKKVLARGLNFSIPPRKLRYCNFLSSFEMLYRKLTRQTISPSSGHDQDSIKTKLKDIALSGYRSYRPPTSMFSNEELKLLKSLQSEWLYI